MSHELQTRIEALRRMVATRDLLIADQEREIRELKKMLHGTSSEPCATCGSTLHHSDLCDRQLSITP